jgi:hypothetical protein
MHRITWSDGVKGNIREICEGRKAMGWKYFDNVNPDHDVQYLKVLRALKRTGHGDICRDLASGDVHKINGAFRVAANSVSIAGIGESDLEGYRSQVPSVTVTAL